MDKEKVLSCLCTYDTRNPYGVASYMTEEELKEEGCKEVPRKDCFCDNCFYGKTELALYILKLLNKQTNGQTDEQKNKQTEK